MKKILRQTIDHLPAGLLAHGIFKGVESINKYRTRNNEISQTDEIKQREKVKQDDINKNDTLSP